MVWRVHGTTYPTSPLRGPLWLTTTNEPFLVGRLLLPRRADGKWRLPARTGGQSQQPLRHLIHSVALHARAAVGARGAPDAGEQEPQKVVAFGGGGHRGSRISAGVFSPR